MTKDLGIGVLGLAYSATNAKDDCSATATGQDYCFPLLSNPTDLYSAGKSRAVLSFSKTF